ncbi:MAG: hypothetical protein IPN34_18995 [Planctomycetes bacterium]|nr:hypothetical protein [Planctomycetota bacterium]
MISLRAARVAALVAALCPLAAAQRPSAWAELPLGGPFQPSAVRQLGKTCAYLQGTTLHAFSAFTKSWTALTSVGASAQLDAFNDLAWAWDRARFSAFSAYRGRFESIAIGPGAQLLNPPSQRNDSILVVQDGSTLWTFSAFTGQWTSRALQSSAPLLGVQRHTLVLADGATFAGFSAFRGRWVDLATNDSAVAAQANGSWGVIEGAQQLYGFSAERETWATHPLLAGPTQSFAGEDLVLYSAPGEALAYSGLTGTFRATQVPITAMLRADALIGAVRGGVDLHLFSAVLGTWRHEALPTSATAVQVMPQIAIWHEPTTQQLSAYSPFTGQVAAAPEPSVFFQANQACAYSMADLQSKPLFFSALAGAWFPAPSDVKVEQPTLTWCGSLVRTDRGHAAFSGRSGRFVNLPTGPTAQPRYDVNSSVIAVEEAHALHVFDARFERWASVPKQSSGPLSIAIWRTSLVAVDGAFAHGFGTLSGELETIALPAPPTLFAANSESARVAAGGSLFAFGATPDLTTLHQFPEFRRVLSVGGTLELNLRAESGSSALLAIGRASAQPQNLSGYGEWWVDLVGASFVGLSIPAGEVRGAKRFAVPLDPSLRGLEPALQAWVLPPSGAIYATQPTTVGIR